MEQEEYTKEEIDWSYIEFVDNQDVLDLIEKVRYIYSFFHYSYPFNMVVYANGCTHIFMYILFKMASS